MLAPGFAIAHREWAPTRKTDIDPASQSAVRGWTPAGGDTMSAEDVAAINDHTTGQAQEILRVLEANLGASAVNNPRAWLNAGIAMRLGADERARLAPLLDDEAKLTAAIGQLGVQPAEVNLDDVRAALRLALADIRLTVDPAAPEPPSPTPGV